MVKINLQSKLKQNENIFANKIDNEAVMLNEEIGKYFGMNEVATDIWEALKTENTVQNLYQHLSRAYDISLEKCQQDVEPFLHQLIENGLVKLVKNENA